MGTFLVLVGFLVFLAGALGLILRLLSKVARRPIRFALRIPAAVGLALLGMVVIAIGGAFMPASPETSEARQPNSSQAQETQTKAKLEETPAQAPWIKVKASPSGPFTVDVAVTTNLPDEALLAASLGLADQGPNDTFIGTDFEKINVKDGKASFVIDGRKRVMPMNSTLPAGAYDVEVSFHPLWEENRAVAAKLNVAESVEGAAKVQLGGSGESSTEAQAKADLSKWVMMNVNMGDKWDEAYYTAKLGNYQELPLENGNPKILKVYYFPKIDMTFIVNVYKGEITVWRDGMANR